MTDYLETVRQALAWAERFPHARMGIETRPILDAAGRLVRLAETGPDYEAAARVLVEKVEGYERSNGDVPSSRVIGHWIQAIVDAAVPWLSDSPPDRPGQRIEWCKIHNISANQTVTLIKHGERICYVAAYSGDLVYDEFGDPAVGNCHFVSR